MDEVIYLMDPQTSKAAANLINQSAFHGRVMRREQACLLHRADGTVCYVTDVVSPVLDATGAMSGMVIVLHDSTLDIDRARDLHHRALHDPLTGLSNRADFEQQLAAGDAVLCRVADACRRNVRSADSVAGALRIYSH